MRFFRNLFAFLFVVIAIAAGVGYYLEWYHVSMNKEKNSLEVTLDKEKVNSDAKSAEKSVNNLAKTDPSKKEHTIKGSIVEVRTDGFTVQSDNTQKTAILTENKSQIKLQTAGSKSEIHVQDIKIGDRVTVTYGSEGEKNVADLVTVERGS